jgi:hypothetical protein
MAATVRAGAKSRPATRDHLPPASKGHADAAAAPGVLRFSSSSDKPQEREPLFYIDDTEYTIPVDPSPSIGLEAIHIVSEGGGNPVAMAMADDYVMTQMLGEDGWAALRGCKTITAGDYRHLVKICSERAMGALEDPNP